MTLNDFSRIKKKAFFQTFIHITRNTDSFIKRHVVKFVKDIFERSHTTKKLQNSRTRRGWGQKSQKILLFEADHKATALCSHVQLTWPQTLGTVAASIGRREVFR